DAPPRSEHVVTLRLGRLALDRPSVSVGEFSQGESVSLAVRARNGANPTRLRRELLALRGRTVPVAWTADESWSGWYTVEDVSVDVIVGAFAAQATVIDAALSLTPVADARVDHESLFVGATINNDFGLDGVQWDAPPAGVTSYFSQGTIPTSSARASED